MFRHIKAISTLTGLFLVMVSRVGAQECSRLQGASPAELTSYLAGTARSPENEPCAAFAINQLGSEHYKPATTAVNSSTLSYPHPAAHSSQCARP